MGLSLPTLLGSRAVKAAPVLPTNPLSGDLGATLGRAKNIIFLWLQGGPPQHETFDPEPNAPLEIRGPFKPIDTNVPGIQFSELLPRTALYTDQMAVVRSLSTRDDNHDVSGYWLLTGYPYLTGSARQIKPTDWPYFGSIVKMLKPSERPPAMTSVWIPDAMRLNDNVTPAGQTAGFLGTLWEPERFVGDPALPDYQIEGLSLLEAVTRVRMDRRLDLLRQSESHITGAAQSGAMESWNRLSQQAFDLVTSGEAHAAFDLSREPDNVRDRYGRNPYGQQALLARRLVEAGTSFANVVMEHPGGASPADTVYNSDCHAVNCHVFNDARWRFPPFDQAVSALIEDIYARGLDRKVMIVVTGEFGHTPRISYQKGTGTGVLQPGRDQRPGAMSILVSGGGLRIGQVVGSTNRLGEAPQDRPLSPNDLWATVYRHLAIDTHSAFPDHAGRPMPILPDSERIRELI
jgi:hypothetical protein